MLLPSRVKAVALLLVLAVIFYLIEQTAVSVRPSATGHECPPVAVAASSSSESQVPNVLHFVHFDAVSLPFVSFVCILAAARSQGPDRILLHTNHAAKTSRDPRVRQLKHLLGQTFVVAPAKKPTHVFGQALSSVYHANDVFKIRLAISKGGVFLDQDTFLVRNLSAFRGHEVTLGWPHGQNIGIQLILAKPDAAFMRLWLASYKDYRPSLWYYNAGVAPTEQILSRCPHLVHAVRRRFGVRNLAKELYESDSEWREWREQYAVHLLFRHRDYLAKDDVRQSGILEFDETNILT